MTTKPNNKLLIIVIGILLATNIAMIVFFINGRPAERKGMRAEKRAMMTAFLQKEIGFTSQQLAQYDSLNQQHHTRIKAMFDAAKAEKEIQFKQLAAASFSDSAINRAAALSAGKQKEMEADMLMHCRDIRRICTTAQLPAFDSLFYSMLNKRMDDRKK